jgi:hypothetical protein
VTAGEQLSEETVRLLAADDAIRLDHEPTHFIALVRAAPATVGLSFISCNAVGLQLRMYPEWAVSFIEAIRKVIATGKSVDLIGQAWGATLRWMARPNTLDLRVGGSAWESAILIPASLLDDLCDAIARKAAQANMQEKAGEA